MIYFLWVKRLSCISCLFITRFMLMTRGEISIFSKYMRGNRHYWPLFIAFWIFFGGIGSPPFHSQNFIFLVFYYEMFIDFSTLQKCSDSLLHIGIMTLDTHLAHIQYMHTSNSVFIIAYIYLLV